MPLATCKFPNARWFQNIGKCNCGKPAIGWLMSSRNDKIDRCCQKCADKYLKQADKFQEQAHAITNL